MSVVAIVLIVLGVVILLVLAGGFVAIRRQTRAQIESGSFEESLAAADQALEAARAEDKGWDRAVMEEAVRKAVEDARPGWRYDDLHLVLVDDRPGVEEDRAQFLAMGGGEQVRVALARQDDGGWVAERIE
jgi:hypothetical protein